ncbi:MAG: GtrA family protein [Succinivibrio sp.]|nr:GtrA family protein [Succinivibrio sp.]
MPDLHSLMTRLFKTDLGELVRYGLSGVGATLINIAAFWVLSSLCGVYYLTANALSWIFAFIFAFLTNKLWVFHSRGLRTRRAIFEFWGFLGSRLFTLLLDMLLIWLFIAVFYWPDLYAKILDNLVIIAVNYLTGKYLVFRAPRP